MTGCRNFAEAHQELTALGFTRSASPVPSALSRAGRWLNRPWQRLPAPSKGGCPCQSSARTKTEGAPCLTVSPVCTSSVRPVAEQSRAPESKLPTVSLRPHPEKLPVAYFGFEKTVSLSHNQPGTRASCFAGALPATRAREHVGGFFPS